MDIFFELLFEVMMDGSLELVTHRKVPLMLRVIAGALILAVYGGLIGLCFFWGIKNAEPVLILTGIVILLLTVLAL